MIKERGMKENSPYFTEFHGEILRSTEVMFSDSAYHCKFLSETL